MAEASSADDAQFVVALIENRAKLSKKYLAWIGILDCVVRCFREAAVHAVAFLY